MKSNTIGQGVEKLAFEFSVFEGELINVFLNSLNLFLFIYN
jgi:hypothetical protein